MAVFGVWWLAFYHSFYYEWWVNEQYSYGFIVPLLAGYLVFLRWADKPSEAKEHPEWQGWFIVLSAAVLELPLTIVLGANPEWRAALWVHAILTVVGTLGLLVTLGGWRWMRHFAIPLSLVFFAVPWPTQFEQPIVHTLMRGVSAVTVEVLNFLGHFAEREGNIIHLSSTRIGVEEACSGVRSLQSTLMAAYFLGELFRWKLRYRIALIVGGTAVSLLLNLVRTLLLTLVAIREGTEAMEVVHDPLGHAVSLGSFFILFLLTWLLHRRFQKRRAPESTQSAARNPEFSDQLSRHPHLARIPATILLTVFALQIPLSALWYRTPATSAERALVSFDWSALQVSVQNHPISPTVRSILRYSNGEHVTFQWNRQVWTAYLFRWDEGRVSSHVAIHRPEVCLPSAGFRQVEVGTPIRFEDAGIELSFQSHHYEHGGQDYFVFYATWDTRHQGGVPFTRNWEERLVNAWQGLRFHERQSAELILRGAPSLRAAEASLRQMLRETLQVERSPPDT